MKDCTITGNKAFGPAGALYICADGNSVIEGSKLSGGGYTTTISDNFSLSNCGGIMLSKGNNLTVTGAAIDNNRSEWGSGGLFAGVDTKVTLTNVRMQDNNAGNEGGGIYARGKLNLSHCVIKGCTAKEYGGGILMYSFDESPLIIEDSEITNCQAGKGGGIYFDYGNLTLKGGRVRITDSTAKGKCSNLCYTNFRPVKIRENWISAR